MKRFLFILTSIVSVVIIPTIVLAFGNPTASTQATSAITSTTATFNGTVVSTGGLTVTTVGFAWGTNSALSGGDTATTTQTVSITVNGTTFTYAASSLTCNTTYYDRAYDVNGEPGTGYGSIVSFTTSSCSSGTPQIQIRSGTLNIKSGSVIIK